MSEKENPVKSPEKPEKNPEIDRIQVLRGLPVPMVDGPDQPGGPNKKEYDQVLAVTAGLADALEKSDIPVEVATSAAILLAAELAAQSMHHNKDVIEAFRRTFVAARKRFREAQN